VCDIGLPGLDGFAVARSLRQGAKTSGAHLIAMTGYGRKDDIGSARSVSFDHHLVKPANPETPLNLLERGR
jgi:CheY-like chemotaxis protein